MATYERVKKAFSAVTRFLKKIRNWIITLTMILALAYLISYLTNHSNQSMQNDPVNITCNDQRINRPMQSKNKIFMKNALIGIGFTFALMFHGLTKTNEKIISFRSVWWCLTSVIGLLISVLASMRPTHRLAPNFLAACQPLGIDLLCGPDSHDLIGVTCTTPASTWINARSNSLPIVAAMQSFLMFTLFFYILLQWCRSHRPTNLCTRLKLQTFNIFSTLCIGLVVVHCNEVDFVGIIVNYLNNSALACGWVVMDYILCWIEQDEPELPFLRNDVLNTNIVPQTGQIPYTQFY